MIPLGMCKIGVVVIIKSIRGTKLAMRLAAMGLRPGDRIRIVSKISHGPIIIENLNNGTRIALGRGMTYKILVSQGE